MKKTLLILLFLTTVSTYSNGFNNQGAKISLVGAVMVRGENALIKNDNFGTIKIENSSLLRIEGEDLVNEPGSFIDLLSNSIIELGENLINKGNYNNEENSLTKVRKNVVNSGVIYNESVIEIGE